MHIGYQKGHWITTHGGLLVGKILRGHALHFIPLKKGLAFSFVLLTHGGAHSINRIALHCIALHLIQRAGGASLLVLYTGRRIV